ncbi:MAG: BlaI/MecI/CopY family transcriptional regulator [Deltaproteobacteria bacterium]|nr:BlaI/MecI/CopY family transcriptional regulator [Deltaproteobacteria bacterium]
MKLSEAEWKVMGIIWQRQVATVRDVLEDLQAETGWAYSTVKTLLARLVDKGALKVSKRANVGHFEAVVSQPEARRSAFHSLLDRAFEGTFGSLMQHLVADERLSPRDKEQLRDLLEELDPADATRPDDPAPEMPNKLDDSGNSEAS